jgi:hypothetical protein
VDPVVAGFVPEVVPALDVAVEAVPVPVLPEPVAAPAAGRPGSVTSMY